MSVGEPDLMVFVKLVCATTEASKYRVGSEGCGATWADSTTSLVGSATTETASMASAAGLAGSAGSTGSAGSAGSEGSAGLTGSAGLVGLTGSAGLTGDSTRSSAKVVA